MLKVWVLALGMLGILAAAITWGVGRIWNCGDWGSCDRVLGNISIKIDMKIGEVSKNICLSVQVFLCLYKPMGIVQGCGNILGKLRLPPAQRS
ncbi:hypothetical protein, partial [Anabaena sp. CCY 0017]|uniref:hypothetical protein n=1 Tax=Anabaena sp. CCY 0017 TaxID=3103866 RepID=UPI0039C6AAEF